MTKAAHILVVEDDDTIRDVLVAALRDEGYEVCHAADGQRALDLLSHWRPDIVLLDLMLPVLDGLGFLEQSQARGLTENLPVVVLSASRQARASTARYPACAATITKPFDLTNLLETLERIISQHAA